MTFLGYGVCLWKYQSVFLLRIKNSQQVFLIFGIVIFKCRSFFAAKPNCWTSGNRQKRHLEVKYHQFPLPVLYNECFKFDLRFGCIWTLFSFNCIVNHFAAFLRWMVHIKPFVWLLLLRKMVHFLTDSISKKDAFRLFTLSCNFLTLAIVTLMWKEKCLYH